uniref:Uncharacterized protein n=1 Tax=Alexandrium monilatum TaxID=311494 RepID=A0A7S4QAH1_9DINO
MRSYSAAKHAVIEHIQANKNGKFVTANNTRFYMDYMKTGIEKTKDQIEMISQCVLNAKGHEDEEEERATDMDFEFAGHEEDPAQIEFEGLDAFIGANPSIEDIVTNNFDQVFCDVTGGSFNDSPFATVWTVSEVLGFVVPPSSTPLTFPPTPIPRSTLPTRARRIDRSSAGVSECHV